MASTRFMVEELRREREKSSLNLEELTHFIDGSEFITEKKRHICKCTRTRHDAMNHSCVQSFMEERSAIPVLTAAIGIIGYSIYAAAAPLLVLQATPNVKGVHTSPVLITCSMVCE